MSSLRTQPLRTTLTVHAAFVLTGVVTTLLGPMLPALSARWGLNDVRAGYLFTAQFGSSIAGVALSSATLRRRGYKWTLLAGVLSMSGGIAWLAVASWWQGLTAVCLYGIGLGFAIPVSNMLISEAYEERRAAALNLLNFSWGMGAVACPFMVALFQRQQATSSFLWTLSAALVVAAAGLAVAVFPPKPASTAADPVPFSQFARYRLLIVLGALFFLYVGTESALGGWLASYAHRVDPAAGTLGTMTPSFFWGALLAGRAIAPLLLRAVREATLGSAGLALACFGAVVLINANGMEMICIGAALGGFGLAPVFPINISSLSHRFGETATRVSGWMFGLAGVGGAVLPWVVGAISTAFANLKIGLFVPLGGAAICLALYLVELVPKAHARAAVAE